jgi:uncharacterized protein YpmB
MGCNYSKEKPKYQVSDSDGNYNSYYVVDLTTGEELYEANMATDFAVAGYI